jgi:hypothetical protein
MKIRRLYRRLRVLLELPDEVNEMWQHIADVSTRVKALEDQEQ